MSADILAKLKIKNIPVAKQNISLLIPKQQPLVKEAIQLKINEIKADANWFEAVRAKATANQANLIQQLRADAIWVLQHP